MLWEPRGRWELSQQGRGTSCCPGTLWGCWAQAEVPHMSATYQPQNGLDRGAPACPRAGREDRDDAVSSRPVPCSLAPAACAWGSSPLGRGRLERMAVCLCNLG